MSVGSNFSVEPVSPLPWPPYSFQSPYTSQSSHNSFLSFLINSCFVSRNISGCVAQNISKGVSPFLLLLLPPYSFQSPSSSFQNSCASYFIQLFLLLKIFLNTFHKIFQSVCLFGLKNVLSPCPEFPHLMLLFYLLLPFASKKAK